MRSVAARISTAVVLTLAFACQFKPDDHYINPVKPPAGPPSISIDLTSPMLTDPYFLTVPTTFTFDAVAPDNPLVNVQVIVDQGGVSATTNGNHFEFQLIPTSLSTGTHNVTVIAQFSLNDGSVAATILNASYQYKMKFQVIADNDRPVAASPLTAKVENGYMTLNLTTNKKYPFKLIVNLLDLSNNLIEQREVNVDGQQFTYIDSGYVGQPTRYVISSKFNSDFPIALASTDVTTSPTTFALVDENGKTELQWTSTLKDAKVIIYGRDEVISAIEDGSAVLESPVLGEKLTYTVKVTKNLYPKQALVQSYTIGDNPNIPAFSDFTMISQSRFGLVLVTGFLFNTYSLSNFADDGHYKPIFQFPGNCYSSYDGSLVAVRSDRSGPIVFSATDFNNTSQFNAYVEWNGSRIRPLEVYAVSGPSNNNYVALNMSLNQSRAAGVIHLADHNALTVPNGLEYYDSLNYDAPTLSPDGQYFVLNSRDGLSARVFKRNNDATWETIGNVKTGKRFFRNTGSPELIVISQNTIDICSVTSPPPDASGSFSSLRSVARPALQPGEREGQTGYDHFTEQLWFETIDDWGISTIRTYDVQSLQLMQTVKAFVGGQVPLARHYYSNNYHFVSTGYAEKTEP